jgi:hypothetical protein
MKGFSQITAEKSADLPAGRQVPQIFYESYEFCKISEK